MQKIQLIYILGMGHSGSTLLDLILDRHPDIESIGEIRFFKKFMENNMICSCQRKFKECPYWQEILDLYHQKRKGDSSPCDLGGKRRLSTLDYIRNLKQPLDGRLYTREEIHMYGMRNYHLFKSILESQGKKIILDSSKDWQRLYLLYASGLFDIKIIYLYRDGRSNLESNKRKDKKLQINWYYPGPVSQTIRFIKTHITIRRFLRNNIDASRIYGLEYKAFTKNFGAEINQLLEFLEIEPSPELFSSFSGEIHNIGGNGMRFQNIDFDNIRPRLKWKKNLTRWEKIVYMLFGGGIINKEFNRHKYQNVENN